MRERTRRRLAALLLVIFAAFACGNMLCVHTHVGADGAVVTHSHPYLPSAHHSHSAQQILTLASVNAIGFDQATGITYLAAPQQLCADLHYATHTAVPVAAGLDSPALRAPPVIV